MATIQEFIKNNVGKPNMTPKALILEAYEMGVAHGKGEEYSTPEPEEVEVEEEEEATVIASPDVEEEVEEEDEEEDEG